MTVVTAIRRYPVKSMGGETLDRVELDARGLVGDRAWAVRDGESRLASGKNTKRLVRRDGVFAFSAAMRAEGVGSAAPHSVSGAVSSANSRPGSSRRQPSA